MTTLSHAPYSPDLAPCDFFLFPRMKKNMKGHRYEDLEEVKMQTRKELAAISKKEYEECFKQWEHRMDKCIALNGEYTEGVHLNL